MMLSLLVERLPSKQKQLTPFIEVPHVSLPPPPAPPYPPAAPSPPSTCWNFGNFAAVADTQTGQTTAVCVDRVQCACLACFLRTA